MPRHSKLLQCSALFAGLLLAPLQEAAAQGGAQPVIVAKDAPVQEISRAEFLQHIHHLQEIVRACRLSTSACGSDIATDDKVVAESRSAAFFEHWNWLRDTLQSAAKAKQDERIDAMDAAQARLSELQAEAGSTPVPGQLDVDKAQKKAAEVLARPEFRFAAAAQPTWLDRKWAQFWMWFASLFEGARRFGAAVPWLGKFLEWAFFILAGVGLLLFIRRSFARQQLQIALSSGATQFSAWDREANDWASEAETRAANREWRDAVHCLYWAAIVRLEARRAWRHNPARTPREYVRLLQPGSSQQSALRGLTGIFERVWYGLRDAEPTDYERAKTLFSELSQGKAVSSAGAAS